MSIWLWILVIYLGIGVWISSVAAVMFSLRLQDQNVRFKNKDNWWLFPMGILFIITIPILAIVFPIYTKIRRNKK